MKDDRTVSYESSGGWRESTANYMQAISTTYTARINTVYERPKPYEVLHDYEWFKRQADADASKATFKAGLVIALVTALIGAMVLMGTNAL